MADVFTKNKRSEIMRAVKSHKNKSTEIKFISILKNYKISGWKRKYKLYGKPDFVFLKYKVAIFIDGCFWHGHACRNTKPKSNYFYWKNKIHRNMIRDKEVNIVLRKQGWIVLRIWECNLKNKTITRFINRINKFIADKGCRKIV